MFRIRQVLDDTRPVNQEAIAQAQRILSSQFTGLSEEEISKLPDRLRNPFKYRFRSVLFVADDLRGSLKGFALLLHAPDLNFCYLDFISAAKERTGGGIGGALYERVREEAASLRAVGLFYECLPDDPKLCRDPRILRQNIARLRFYEQYDARPIAHTKYETPVRPKDDNPPYLVLDNLGGKVPLPRDVARPIVRAILERKYGNLCPSAYIDSVVESFQDDPVQLRSPKYVKTPSPALVKPTRSEDQRIALVMHDQHHIHHVRERGYVESPVRIRSILKEIQGTDLFEEMPVRHFSEKNILAVHDHGFVAYLKRVSEYVKPGRSVYPYVFPIRNVARPPKELPIRAGYYCIDTFTPINENAYRAAKRAVDCALTAADAILKRGYRLAYALVRPPGHHAERRSFGGFCYFNSASIAANCFSARGRVAVLDIDYHHGNGTQDIFYNRSDVLTLSLHGNPRFAYPYFTGFEDEAGEEEGRGYNRNYPLPERLDARNYRDVLARALGRIRRFKADYLVVALGLDPAKGDPTGTWDFLGKDFEENGKMIGAMGLPTLVVQEGGYRTRSLGINARHFFLGLWAGAYGKG